MLTTLTQIFGDLHAGTLLYLALGAYFSATFHSITVFGGGLILSMLLAPVIGIKAVVPVIAVSLLISHSSRVWAFRKGFTWNVYRDLMTTAFPGIIVGAVVYSYLPTSAIALLMGIFLISMIPLRRLMHRRNVSVGKRTIMGIGVPFGVLSGSTVGAGLILAPFMLAVGLAGEALAGTMAAVALTVNVTKAVVFGGFSVLDPGLAMAGFLVGLCTIPGNLTGRWIVRRTAIRVHILVVEAVIVAGGVYFIYAAGDHWGWWG
jgi:uncharacterized membrane protein YfcA